MRPGFKSHSGHPCQIGCQFCFGFEFQSLTCLSRSHNSPDHLAQIYTIGSFYTREGQSWNSRVQQVSTEVHWQRWKGELTSSWAPASSEPGSGQCNDFLTFSSTKFGSDRKKKKVLKFYRYIRACKTGMDFKVCILSWQTSESEHDVSTLGNVGFISLRILGGNQTMVPPTLLYFLRM